MSKWRIEYHKEFTETPLSYWVHKEQDSDNWWSATQFEPPLPAPVINKGYPRLCINLFGVRVVFSSVNEVEHFLSVISQKNMPTTTQLSRARNSNYGPNGHWLSRLPAKLKPWSRRKKMTSVIEKALQEYRLLWNN
ncbi:hypothetical protein [Vibrio sp. SCSIO 43137]|uniref:hypothetical protein n=1 Tax=Vibrio sp. SCSIO 43137 TaxID=3021011 RepID=UPI002307B4F7|nr:hypothetical protein [Vibrio sp. SCSIO 43137]WCE31553.1 hypothetical protein PK654_20720 [Vibrio sp. SCSIO 43137]